MLVVHFHLFYDQAETDASSNAETCASSDAETHAHTHVSEICENNVLSCEYNFLTMLCACCSFLFIS